MNVTKRQTGGWVLDTLSTGTEGTGPCLVLSLEVKSILGGDYKPVHRFIFNACESFQRLCKERKVKLAKIEQCFVTAMRPSHVVGLPGLILGLSDAGAASLNIYGPEGISNFVSAAGKFVRRKWPVVQVTELPESKRMKEKNVVKGDNDITRDQGSNHNQNLFTTIFENDSIEISAYALFTNSSDDSQPFQPTPNKRQRVENNNSIRSSNYKNTNNEKGCPSNYLFTPPACYKCVMFWKNKSVVLYIVDCPN